MKINSKNSETSNLHYGKWICVNKKTFGSFRVGSKKLDYKWVVYPSLGAHLEHISQIQISLTSSKSPQILHTLLGNVVFQKNSYDHARSI